MSVYFITKGFTCIGVKWCVFVAWILKIFQKITQEPKGACVIGYGVLARIGCRQLGAVGKEDIVHLIQIDDLVPDRKGNL